MREEIDKRKTNGVIDKSRSEWPAPTRWGPASSPLESSAVGPESDDLEVSQK